MTNLKMFICAIALTASFGPLSASAQDCADGSITCGADYFDRANDLEQLRWKNGQYLTNKQTDALDASQSARAALVREAMAANDKAKFDLATAEVRKEIEAKAETIQKITKELAPLEAEQQKAHADAVEARRVMDEKLAEYRAGKLTVKQMKPYVAKHEAALAELKKERPDLGRLRFEKNFYTSQLNDLEKEIGAIKMEIRRRSDNTDSGKIRELRAVQSGDAAFEPLEKAAKLANKENKTIVKALRALGVGGAALGVIAGTAAQAGESDASVIASNSLPSKKSAPALINRPDAPDTFMSVGSVE